VISSSGFSAFIAARRASSSATLTLDASTSLVASASADFSADAMRAPYLEMDASVNIDRLSQIIINLPL
jgi:hypothetical protein